MLGDVSGEVFIFVVIEYKSNIWNNMNREVKMKTERGRNTKEKEKDGEKRALKCQGVTFPRAGRYEFMPEERKIIINSDASQQRREKDQQATCRGHHRTAHCFQMLALLSQATCDRPADILTSAGLTAKAAVHLRSATPAAVCPVTASLAAEICCFSALLQTPSHPFTSAGKFLHSLKLRKKIINSSVCTD